MMTSSPKRRGGVLFCGGCNPRYDRLQFFEELLRYYNDGLCEADPLGHVPVELELFRPEKHWDFIAIINGCSSECLIDRAGQLPTVMLSSGVLEDAYKKIDGLFAPDKK